MNVSENGFRGAFTSIALPREWLEGFDVPLIARFSYDHGPHASPEPPGSLAKTR